MQKTFVVFILSVFTLTGFSQDTIQLINGNKIVVASLTLDEKEIVYRKPDSKKLKNINYYKVFSVLYKDGTENVLFTTDSLDPDDFKVEEMRSFIKGEQDAKLLYRTNYIVPAVGVGVGAASATFAIWGLAGPALYSTIIGYFSPNVDKQLSFKVSGDAAKSLGINDGTYLNEVSSANGTIKKDQFLKINSKKITFSKDTGTDEAVSIINEKFKKTRVRAMNNEGKVKLFKGSSPALINDSAYREGYSKKVREKNITSALIAGFSAFIATYATLVIVSNND